MLNLWVDFREDKDLYIIIGWNFNIFIFKIGQIIFIGKKLRNIRFKWFREKIYKYFSKSVQIMLINFNIRLMFFKFLYYIFQKYILYEGIRKFLLRLIGMKLQ